jgi:general secretion pathway protein F
MPEFTWEAADPGGSRSRGRLVASSEADALRDLEGRGLLPLRVREAGGGRSGAVVGSATGGGGGLSLPSSRARRPVLEFTRGVAALLPAGMPLARALAVSAGGAPPRVREGLDAVRERVERGEELARALEAEPALFSPLYVGMVRAGERGGSLDRAFERLALHLEAEDELRSRLVSMSIYPALLALTGLASVLVLVLFVLPRFADILAGSGAPLPGVTAFVLGASEMARAQAPLLGVLAVALVGALVWMRGTAPGREVGARLLLALPVVGAWRRQVLAARFARMCGELVSGGAPVLPALDDTRACLGDPVARDAVGRVRTRVREGGALHRALAAESLFPRELEQLVALGEEAGRLADFLLKAADLLERRTTRSVERMVALAEPVVIVGFGGVIAVVALSLLQAIYGINAGGL